MTPSNHPSMNTIMKRPPKRNQDKDTLEIDWIQEEEQLRNSKELLQKQVLEKVSIRFVFVDAESNILMDTSYKQPLLVNVEKNHSILSKTTLLQCIQTAKTESIDSVFTKQMDTSVSISFSIMDILIWNVDVETDYLQPYAESLPPEWIGREFMKGNINDDIVFLPSLCIFHSIQTVYVFLRVSFRKNTPEFSLITTPKKYTRRKTHK